MQKIIIKDLLKVLFEKCNSLKNILMDRNRIHQIFNYTSSKNLEEYNKKLEETIGLMLEISEIVLQEFYEKPEKIGIVSKPYAVPEYYMKVFQECEALHENLIYFADVSDFLKDSIDSYMIMKRQRDRDILSDILVNKLIKYISKCRFNMGELSEQYVIYEKNFLDKKKRGELPILPMKKSKYMKKPTLIMTPREVEIKKELEKIKEKKNDFAKKIHILNTLLQNKFNSNKTKFLTREAKVNLNQEDFETQKALLILEDEKTIKYPIANNLKKVQIEKLKHPFTQAETLLSFSRNYTALMDVTALDAIEN